MNYLHEVFLINEDRSFGFSFSDKKIKFLIPELLLPADSDNFSVLKKYNLVLKKYSRSISKDLQYSSSYKFNEQDILNLETISSYINILDDYFSNNEFFLLEKYYNKDSKKIKWSKTLKENDIIVSKNNIIYNSFISQHKRINNYHNYYLLYQEALRRSKSIFLGEFQESNSYPESYNEQSHYLYQYTENHFRDREIFINRNLINIYLNRDLNNYNEKIFEVKYHTKFEFIWQNMIENIISQYNFKVKINSGKYIEKNKTGLLLFQDHFISYNNNYYLLDSKFYKTYHNENYPDTDSIAKQYMYHHLISQQYDIDPNNITNIFIFPKNNPENTAPELFDRHIWQNNKHLTIYCIALDINTVIDLYLKNSTYIDFIKYLEKIPKENNIETIKDPINQIENEIIKVTINGIETDLPLKDIIFFKADMKSIAVYIDKKEFLITNTLLNLEQQCPNFIKIHRAYLINPTYISAYHKKDSSYFVTLKNYQEDLPVSRRSRQEIEGKLNYYAQLNNK